jgi:uncharacterized OB-fold protein
MHISPVKLWRRQKTIRQLIGTKGKLLHWTIIRVPSKSFANQAPYPVGIVELSSGERMIGQLVDWQKEDLEKGHEVIAVLRKHNVEDKEGIIPYVIKFKPV